MMRLSNSRTPIVFLVVACGLWGFATVISKYLLSSTLPVTLLVLQLSPSAFLLWLIWAASRPLSFDRRALFPLIVLGLLNPGLSYTLSLFALARISASVATLIWAAEPIMIMALAGVILREPVTSRLVLVMLVGAAGVLLVTGLPGFGADSTARMTGILLMLAAVFCCAIYTVFSRKVGANVDPLLTAAIQQTAGLAWALSLLPLEVSGGVAYLTGMPLPVTLVAMGTGLLYYAAAYWLYLSALKSVPAAVAGSFFNLIPLFGIALASLLLGETLTIVQWIGAAAILVSVLLLLRGNPQLEGANSGQAT